MPSITATIDRDQRDGLYELIRNHLGAIGDIWIFRRWRTRPEPISKQPGNCVSKRKAELHIGLI